MSSYHLYQNLNLNEIEAMNSFLKVEITNLINLLKQNEKEGFIAKVEIPYIIRSFLQFPSQLQIVDEIIPAIEKLESTDQKDKETCEIEGVIKHIIIILKNNQYSSYDKDLLLKSFKTLDSDNKGYLDLHTMFYIFKGFGVNFSKENIKEMEKFCLENENDLLDPLPIMDDIQKKHDQYTTRKFYYENYVRKLEGDNKSKFKQILSKFFLFLSQYNQVINKK